MIDLSPGSIFAGQFRIVRPLAKGGMGAVYVVEQAGTGRERALKLMHPILVADEKSVERFEREARVGSLIDSDHVVEVVAAGVEPKGPTPWLCMELLKGETLADRIEKRGPAPRGELIEIMRQLGHAIVAAHKAGIIHRDLKPENIFLAESRRVGAPFTLKVLDFGVATLTTEMQGPKTTQGVGSPMWMAPEQTNVGKVVAQTDLWALGLIVFYLLTGKSYWLAAGTEGSTITALLVEILVEPLVPASERARVLAPEITLPPGLDAWLGRLLVRDPKGRFASAEETFAALHAVLRDEVPRTSSPQAFDRKEALVRPASSPSVTHPPPALIRVPHQSTAFTASQPAVATKRRVWPWVFFAMFAFGGTCVAALAWHAMTTIGEAAQGIAQSGGLQVNGRRLDVRDPETGQTVISLSREGMQVTSPNNATEETHEVHEEAADEANEEETEADADEADASDKDETDAGVDETDEAGEAHAPRRPRVQGARNPTDSTAAGAGFYRNNVIHNCLQELRNGRVTLPRALYRFHRDGQMVPNSTPIQQRFEMCVMTSRIPDADYTFALP